MVIKLKIDGIIKTIIKIVSVVTRAYVKFRNLINVLRFFTSAVDAVINNIIGDSIINANENATPYAAKLNSGFAIRAIIAERNGPSTDIISQVAESGIQKRKILLNVSLFNKILDFYKYIVKLSIIKLIAINFSLSI